MEKTALRIVAIKYHTKPLKNMDVLAIDHWDFAKNQRERNGLLLVYMSGDRFTPTTLCTDGMFDSAETLIQFSNDLNRCLDLPVLYAKDIKDKQCAMFLPGGPDHYTDMEP